MNIEERKCDFCNIHSDSLRDFLDSACNEGLIKLCTKCSLNRYTKYEELEEKELKPILNQIENIEFTDKNKNNDC